MEENSENDANPSGINSLKELLQETKSKCSNENKKRWPYPFCLEKNKSLIQCTIHIKNDHPAIYKIR